MTGQGKTWFIKKTFSKIARLSAAELFILTPVDISGWPRRAKVFTDTKKFVAALENYMASGKPNAHVYIDEFADLQTAYRHYSAYPAIIQKIASMSRHYGITAWLAAQRPANIHPNIRDNCARIVCFRLKSESDAILVENDSAVKTINGKRLRDIIGGLSKLNAVMVQGDTARTVHV